MQPTGLSTACSAAAGPRFIQPEAARGRGLSQGELTCLLDEEEDAFFCSRASHEGEDEATTDATDEVEDTKEADVWADATTIMVRNIACRLSTEAVRGMLHDLGFEGCYDFFYLPFCRKGNANAGYFFLNMKKVSDVARCKALLQGQPLGRSEKRCDVVLARWQGLEELRAQFSSKAVMKAGHGKAPMFL